VRLEYARPEARLRRPLNRRLIILLLLAAGVRLGWVLRLPPTAVALDSLPDQREYLELANSLRHAEFCFVDPRFADVVYAYRTPGYPALVALCNQDPSIVRIVQAILDTSSVLAVYLVARRWLSVGPSLFAAGVVALNPFLIYFCGLILSETLFTTMLIWGMTLLVLRQRASDADPVALASAGWRESLRSLRLWVGGVALLALSVLVRPSAIVLPVLLSVTAAFVNRWGRQPYDSRWIPPVATLALGLTILALLPWAWRNDRVLGSWIWTTTNSGITLYDGLSPDATGASDQRFVRDMPQLKSMDEVGRSRYLGRLAWDFAREHPLRAAELAVIKIARTWSPVPLSRDYGGNVRYVVVGLLYTLPFFALAIMGLWSRRAPRSAKVFLVAPAVYFTLVHAVSVGSLRYRIPSDVPMAVMAALGACVAIRK
jgi:4-amino-4-deoxy-L-arabinose transferase-like glycosyltransferase